MMWAVAARFHFSATELKAMKISELLFWYRGHAEMIKEERSGTKV